MLYSGIIPLLVNAVTIRNILIICMLSGALKAYQMNYKSLICRLVGHRWNISTIDNIGNNNGTARRTICERCGASFEETRMPYQVTITEDAKVRTELHNLKQLQEIIRDFNGSKGMSKLIIKKVH